MSTLPKYGLTANDLNTSIRSHLAASRRGMSATATRASRAPRRAHSGLRAVIDAFLTLIALIINCRSLEAAIHALLDCKDSLGELDKAHFTRTTRGFVIDFIDENGSEISVSAFAIFMILTSVIRHYLPPTQFARPSN